MALIMILIISLLIILWVYKKEKQREEVSITELEVNETSKGSFNILKAEIQRPDKETATPKVTDDNITKNIGITVEYSGRPPQQIIPEIIASLTKEVRVCPDCGFDIVPASAKYCWNCGAKIEKPVKNTYENIVISLPLEDYVITALNKIGLEEIKAIDEYDYDGQVVIQQFCDLLIENKMASAQLCKKVGALLAKQEEYESAIHYYEVAMDIDPNLDLTSQIERWNKKLYNY